MKKLIGIVGMTCLLLATPAMAASITLDYARDFDFSKVKTFQYVETDKTKPANAMMADRIVALLKEKLKAGGLREVTEDPDMYVTYHVTAQQNLVLNTSTYGYGGYGRGWGGWGGGMASSTTTVMTYIEGTLIIDAYKAEDKKMVWRGTGTVTVGRKPDKQIRQVETILRKLGTKWQKILAAQGK